MTLCYLCNFQICVSILFKEIANKIGIFSFNNNDAVMVIVYSVVIIYNNYYSNKNVNSVDYSKTVVVGE